MVDMEHDFQKVWTEVEYHIMLCLPMLYPNIISIIIYVYIIFSLKLYSFFFFSISYNLVTVTQRQYIPFRFQAILLDNNICYRYVGV